MTKPLNLVGQKFGRLTVIERAENDKKGNTRWLCSCSCGGKTTVGVYHLTRGKIQSCGCIKKEMLSNRDNAHHKAGTRLYSIWAGIKERCFNSNHKNYDRYKGRGITMCDEWKDDFMSFYNWAIKNGYKNGLTIERINNDGNYSPANCRWATREEQANNTSRNHFIVFNGEKHTIADWAKKFDIDYKRLNNRINSGLPLEKCFYKGKLSNNGKDFYERRRF